MPVSADRGLWCRKLFFEDRPLPPLVNEMVIGFILISTAPAKEHDVFKALMNVTEIVELHPLFGEYDLIAKIEARDFNTLGQIVVEKVRSIPGVIDTKTLTGIKFS